MILMDAVQVWARITGRPIRDYFAEFKLDERLDRDTLVNDIFMEFGNLNTCDSDTNTFRERVNFFFLIHEYNIKKLVDTMEYEYNPLTNVDMHHDRDAHYDQLDDEHKTDTRDLTREFGEQYKDKQIFGRDQNTDTTNDVDTKTDTVIGITDTEDRTEKEITKQNIIKKDTTDYGEDTESDRDQTKVTDYGETSGSDTTTTGHKEYELGRNETATHFVSAYNQFAQIGNPEEINQAGDVERNRDVTRLNENYDEDTTGTEHISANKDSDETVTDSEGITGHKTSKTTLDGKEDTNKTVDTTENIGKNHDETHGTTQKEGQVGTEIVREDTERTFEYNKSYKLTDDEDKIGTRKNDMDRDETETKHDFGNDGRFSFQELISEERKLAEFNIYKWIIRHMAKELFVCVY